MDNANPNYPQLNETYQLNGYLKNGTPYAFSYTLHSEHKTIERNDMTIEEARKLAHEQLAQFEERHES